MAKLQTKLKGVRLPVGLIDEVEVIQHQKHLTTFTQAVIYLIRIGIDRGEPAYKKKAPRKTEAEKVLERKEAEKLAKELELKELQEKIDTLGGYRSDEKGRKDPSGSYVTYKEYSRIPGNNPVRLAINETTNPLRLIDDIISDQYEGDTKKNIDALLESGDYELMSNTRN